MAHSSWYTRRDMVINMTSEYLKWDYHMLKIDKRLLNKDFGSKSIKEGSKTLIQHLKFH